MNTVLFELLPRKVRLTLYAIVALVGAALSAYQASQGDWLLFSAGLVQFLGGVLAVGNVPSGAPAGDAGGV